MRTRSHLRELLLVLPHVPLGESGEQFTIVSECRLANLVDDSLGYFC